jgi:tetratricopeptide (TPR) repeat protein
MSQDTDHRGDGPARAIEDGWRACANSMYREAESQFEQLRKTGTHSIDGIVGISAVWRAQGLPIAAEELIRQALRGSRGDLSLRRELGYIAFERGHLDRSVEIFTKLVKSDPRCIKDRRSLAAGLRQAKRYPEARAVLDAAPEADHCGLDLERGLIAYAEGDYANAVEHFRMAKAHGAKPDSYVPPLMRALIRTGKADDAQAEAACVQLISSVAVAWAEVKVHQGCPRDAIELMLKLGVRLDESGLTQLVILLLGAERNAEARDIFRKWMCERSYADKGLPQSASPAIVSIWIELAAQDPSLTDRELEGRVESALLRYARPDFVPAAVAVSAIRAMRKIDTVKAEVIAKESIEHHFASVSLLIESAITSFLQRHDYKSALQELDRAIQLEPENERALQWRCRSIRRLGHWKQLETYLSDGNSSIEHSAPLQAERGWFRITQCEYHKAAEAFLDACRLDPSSQDALFGQVTALRKLQRWHEAKTLLTKWKDQWPDSRRQRLAAALLALDR